MSNNHCEELYISYLFPPSNQTSGITVFKRIVKNNEKVDVLQGDFKPSDKLDDLIDSYVDKRYFISVDGTMDWTCFIFDFVQKGLKEIHYDYKKIYSRSWLMANHYLAWAYKYNHNQVFWTAEFSDPLIYDINNHPRQFKQMIIDDEEFISKVNQKIEEFNKKNNHDFPLIENNSSSYFIAEYLVYLFADKIIFTNENQQEIMLNQFPVDIKDLVLNKSEIKMHPTLDESFYHIKNVNLNIDDSLINIAYFGNDYYSKRHFEALFYAVESLNHKFKNKLKIYLYISEDSLVEKLVPSDIFVVKKPLNYLEFLNALTKFDVLIINDLVTKNNFDINPYLPSKLSDYSGSKSDIWALYESGSSLSKLDFKYKSNIEDYDDCLKELVSILEDNGYIDRDYSINKDYLNFRFTVLNSLYEEEFRKNKKLEREIQGLNVENNLIKSSNSWKVTKPLRNLKDKL